MKSWMVLCSSSRWVNNHLLLNARLGPRPLSVVVPPTCSSSSSIALKTQHHVFFTATALLRPIRASKSDKLTTTNNDNDTVLASDQKKYGNKEVISVTPRLYDYLLSNVREPQVSPPSPFPPLPFLSSFYLVTTHYSEYLMLNKNT